MTRKRATKGTRRTVLIYLLILVVICMAVYVIPEVSAMSAETYNAQYGTLEIRDEAVCLFVRNEQVYKASSGGSVDREVSEGKLTRTASKIVDVGGNTYYSEMRGIVSYQYDGYEDLLTPDNMESVTESILEEISGSENYQVREAAKGTASSGDVLFKIIDNQNWYLLCWLEGDSLDKYSEGSAITVDFRDGQDDDNGTRVDMEVYAMIPQGQKTMIILSCDRYYEDFWQYRMKDCYLITSSQSGILLETDSIVEEDGQTGVYVVNRTNNYTFTPIKVLAENGDTTVAASGSYYDADGKLVETVSNYTEILVPTGEDSETSEGDETDVD